MHEEFQQVCVVLKQICDVNESTKMNLAYCSQLGHDRSKCETISSHCCNVSRLEICHIKWVCLLLLL